MGVMTTTQAEIKRYRVFVQDEVDGSYYYSTLASLEEDQQLAAVYSEMAAMEQRHLALWRTELAKRGDEGALPQPSRRARILMWAAKRFGVDAVLPVLKAMEVGADAVYAAEPVAAAAHLPADERTHARIVATLSGPLGGLSGASIGRIESRHRALGGGNALRAAVLGANDGLTSNLALVMGIAGANPGRGTVVLAGIAGLLAGSFSMALGEWISVTSAREAAEAQIVAEREEIKMMPDAERDELALIYRAKGVPEQQARELAAHVMSDTKSALGTLAREELGIVPEELGSPWAAASTSFVLFASGAILPLFPFFFTAGFTAIVLSASLAALGLFTVGSAITLLTGKSAWYAGIRQLVLGLTVAAVTFAIGALIGRVAGL
jgi:VIT1/CCC1 family predicted Fe2+/Mn2+ transporter